MLFTLTTDQSLLSEYIPTKTSESGVFCDIPVKYNNTTFNLLDKINLTKEMFFG